MVGCLLRGTPLPPQWCRRGGPDSASLCPGAPGAAAHFSASWAGEMAQLAWAGKKEGKAGPEGRCGGGGSVGGGSCEQRGPRALDRAGLLSDDPQARVVGRVPREARGRGGGRREMQRHTPTQKRDPG